MRYQLRYLEFESLLLLVYETSTSWVLERWNVVLVLEKGMLPFLPKKPLLFLDTLGMTLEKIVEHTIGL